MAKKKESKGIIHSFIWLFSISRQSVKWSVLGIFSLIVLVTFNLTKVYCIDKLINSAINIQYYDLLYVGGLVVCAIIIGSIASFSSKFSMEKFGALAGQNLRERILKSITKSPIELIERNNSGDMASVINNEIEVIQSFIQKSFKELFFHPIMCVSALVFMLIIDWKLTLVSFSVTPIALIATNQISKRIGKLSNEYYTKMGNANGFVNDSIRGIDTIKAFCIENYLHKKCSSVYEESLNIGTKMDRLDAYMTPFIIILFEFPRILCIVYGGYLTYYGYLTTGSLVAFFQMLSYIIEPSVVLPNLIGDLRKTEGAISRVSQFLNTPCERKTGEDFKGRDCKMDIEFSSVNFSYDGTKKILNNLSFKIYKNSMVALVGQSGSGKSTIFNLLCGFYEHQKGYIKIFDKDIMNCNLTAIRNQISLVSQQVDIFPGTIAENIAFGHEDITMEQIIKASQEANAHEFIIKMPQGYSTVIGADGVGLSGGQKQRIAIARALIKNSPIIIMDEPTSALDLESEALLQDTIERLRKERTIFIIAHRLSTIKQADHILVLHEGQIVEQGTHVQLINIDGHYKQFYNKQFLPKNLAKEERIIGHV